MALEVDEARLVQVVSNLLDNASKYTPDDGRLGIKVDIEGDSCVLRVWDEGIGIPEDLKACVFEMFVQGERMPSRAPGGLGIGLALARRLVELHGGTLELSSPTQGGTTGTEAIIRLPCVGTTARERSAPHPVVSTSPRRILLVEDNLELATMLSELLEVHGHDTRVAQDGGHALEIVEAFVPELVLIDIGLPGKDGYAVARELRERLGSRHKLVAASGYPPDHGRIDLFDEYLLKPVYPHQLASLLE